MSLTRTMRRAIPAGSAAPAGNRSSKLLVLFILSAGFAFVTEQPLLMLTGITGLAVIFKLLWEPGRPSVLFWALLHQWLQLNIGLLYGELFGFERKNAFYFPDHLYESYLLGTASVTAFGLGIWLMTRKLPRKSLSEWVSLLDHDKCFKLYLLFSASLVISSRFLPVQIYILVYYLKTSFLFLFTLAAFANRRYLVYLVVMVLELISATYSFFSIGFFSLLSSPLMVLPYFLRGRVRFSHLLAGLLLTVLLGLVGITWSSVKMDYRSYLAAGVKGQVILVGRTEALKELLHLVTNINTQRLKDGLEALVLRVSYVDFLSGVIGNVPQNLPHEDGAMTLRALKHVVMPRFLFPEKEVFHDTLILNKYLGVFFADYQTTSMSIGYVGDLYVDYGYFAPVAVFLFGLFIGSLYGLLYRRENGSGWSIFLVFPMFLILYLYETSLFRLFGNIITYTLMMLLFAKYVLPKVKSFALRSEAKSTRAGRINPRRALVTSGRRL